MSGEFWSLFAGIEGFGAALEMAGMKCTLQVERDKDCNKVLSRHFPNVRRIDDVNRLRAMLEPRNAKRFSGKFVRPRLICGGFPCQDLSVAGKRAGLAGSRSGLWFTFRRIIALVKPEFVLIENVPGLLSSNGGRDFGTILGALGQCGYGYAYRILDAQHFGVPQRRRRVFIVGCLRDWRRAARILFESDCVPWDIETREVERPGVADCFTAGSHPGGHNGQDDHKRGRLIANCIQERHGKGPDSDCTTSDVVQSLSGPELSRPLKAGGNLRHAEDHETYVTHTLTGEGHDASEDGTGRGTPLVAFGWNKSSSQTMQVSESLFDPLKASRCSEPAICFDTTQITSPGNYSNPEPGDACHPLAAGAHAPAIAFKTENDSPFESDEIGPHVETFAIQERACSESETSVPGGKGYQANTAFTMEARHHTQSVANRAGVRRLTPKECERLQGFQDDWTRFDASGKQIADSPRYRMLGNAVNLAVGKWLANRIVQS